jgi:hypothetical protein
MMVMTNEGNGMRAERRERNEEREVLKRMTERERRGLMTDQ